MSSLHDGGCSVLLQDGRILVSGGSDAGGPTAKVDIFSTNGTWSSAPSMLSPRAHQICALVQSGQVLVAGGLTTGGGITNSAEIFDPTANTWSQLPAMNEARVRAAASLLQNGRVLIAGGQNSSGPSNTLEIFDPNAQQFSFAGTMSAERQDAAAAVLQDGRVLIVGGTSVDANGNVVILASSDIYDPNAGTVSTGPTLTAVRSKHSATTQLDGKVVVIGGSNGSNDLTSIEVFDPSVGGNFTLVSASLATPRSGHLAFLLPKNNQVLVVGGQSAGVDLASAELYVPWRNQGEGAVQTTGSMATARSQASAATLSSVDGLLMVAGGSSQTSAELYSFATVKTDQSDYAPGTTVTITGSGWQPGETVTLTLVESPLIDTHPVMTAVADQNGNIFNNQFSPDTYDQDIRFYLTATGSQSQAQNTFTDSVSSVSITSVSPTTALTSLPANVTVNFNYSTSTAGSTTAEVDLGGVPVVQSYPLASGSNQSTSITFAVPTTTANGLYNVKVIVTNTSGTGANQKNDIANNAVNVNVPPCTPVSGLSIQPVTVTYGQTATFTANISAGATTPITYQWLRNGSLIGGATSSTYSFNPQVSDSGATFSVQVSNPCTSSAATSSATLTVSPALASVTPNAASKVYGSADPTLTGSLSGFLPSDNVVATYSRAPGETVAGSPYTISATLSPAAVLGNYTITYNTTNFTITPAPATWTTQDSSKTYGAPDPNPLTTGSGSGFVASDAVTATYSRATGETVAGNPYHITATLSASIPGALSNYTITNSGANFTISPAPLVVTAISPSVVYGDPVPTITPAYATFVNGDTASSLTAQPTCSTTYTSTSSVSGSPYATSCSGAADTNYSISYVNGTVTVAPKPASVTPNPASKVYGSADPTLTGSLSGFLPSDNVVATYSRAPGETVAGSPYMISATLSPAGVLSNYQITYNTANLTITPRPVTITADAKTKVYGDTDPALTYQITNGNLVSGDTFSGALTRAAGENVGSYAITQGTLALNANYTLTYVGANLTITPRPITVSAVSDTKMYDGTMSSSGNPQVTAGNLAFGNTLNFTQTFDNRNVGTGKVLTPSGSVNDGNGGKDYAVTLQTALGMITARPITVTAAPDSKVFDGTTATVPVTYPQVTSGSIIAGDTGNFTEAFDSPNAGARMLVPSGSVSDGNNGLNYNTTFMSVSGTISQAPTATVLISSVNPSILGQSVMFTATVSNMKTSPVPTGSVQFVVDGANFGSPVALSGNTASFSTVSLVAGPHRVVADYINADGNFVNSASASFSESVGYNFLGFYSPYAPPSAGVAYKVNSAIPLQWQYADVNNNVVASANANPQVYIAGPYACGGTDNATEVLALSSGASGYQYSTSNNEWQFNWKTTGLQPGCYNIYINTGLTSQQTVAYPIQLRN